MTSCTDVTLCHEKLILLMKNSNRNRLSIRKISERLHNTSSIVWYLIIIYTRYLIHENHLYELVAVYFFLTFQQIWQSCRSNNIFIMTLLSTTFWSTRKRWWTYTIIKVLVEWIKPFFLPCVYIFVSQNDSMHAWGSGVQCSSTPLNTTNAKSQFTT